MGSREPGRLGGYALLWLAAVLAAAALLACNTAPADPNTFFQLQADSTWLSYDSLQVWLDKADASAPSLLFAAKVTAVSDLEKIPADGYGNGLVIVTMRAFKDGRVARAENRAYNLAEQRIITIGVLIPPGSAGARRDSVVTKGGFFLSLRPGDTLVSIGDTVPLVAVGWNDSGSLEAQWDLDGDGVPDQVDHPAGVSAVLKARAGFNVPGIYHPSLTLKGSQGGALKSAATVRVVLDPPIADAGPDIEAGMDSEVVLTGRGADGLGRIVKQEWQVGDLPPQEVPDGRLGFRTPSRPGKSFAIFKVTDDDGLIASDTALLSITDPSGTAHTPMPDGVTLSIGAQGAAVYGAVIDIDSEEVWTSSVANARQSGIDLVFLFYEGAFHLEDAVNARAAGIDNSINLTNSYDPAKIVHVDMVRVSAEPQDQETALAVFQSAPAIHGDAVYDGAMYLVRSTGGKLAFLKVVAIVGTDRAGQAAVQLKVLTL